MKQPMPLPAANSKTPEPDAAPLLAAGILLAKRGIYGVVWFGEDMFVTARFGPLVEFVEIGTPVGDSVLALVGLEPELVRIRSEPGAVIDLPSVSIVSTSDTATPRANLTVIWAQEQKSYLLLVGRSSSRSDLEVELSRQMRARLIAEAAVTAKSKELARVNTDLERANSDLEAYASIISHDLKAPMRAFRYMVDDLEAELATGASATVQSKLSALREQSKRMSGMLTALLDYSSVTAKSDMLAETDTHALVTAIVASMPRPPHFKIAISGDWPRMTTLAAPLDLVLRNLVDNAIKHHDDDTGSVTIAACDRHEVLLIEVADDGPGIRPEHQTAVFLPFLKLERSGSTDGHGMGLALVRRTVEGVGGSLTLSSSAPEVRGAIFTIFWPKTLLL